VAYADDITLLVTDPKGIPALAGTLRRYEKATGACLNIRKSKAMAAGSWNTTVNMMDIPHCTEMTILGFQISSTVSQSGKNSRTKVAGQVKTMAREVYSTHSIRARLLTPQNMAHSTNFSRLKGAR